MTLSRLISRCVGAALLGLFCLAAATPASGAEPADKGESPGRHALWFDGQSAFV